QPTDYRDLALCRVYLAAHVMEALGAHTGDVVRVSTSRGRSLVARIAGPHPTDSERFVRFDRYTRQSLKAYPHEEVTVERVDLAPTPEITIMPAIDISMLHVPELVPMTKALLVEQAVPVRDGMLLHVQ